MKKGQTRAKGKHFETPGVAGRLAAYGIVTSGLTFVLRGVGANKEILFLQDYPGQIAFVGVFIVVVFRYLRKGRKS